MLSLNRKQRTSKVTRLRFLTCVNHLLANSHKSQLMAALRIKLTAHCFFFLLCPLGVINILRSNFIRPSARVNTDHSRRKKRAAASADPIPSKQAQIERKNINSARSSSSRGVSSANACFDVVASGTEGNMSLGLWRGNNKKGPNRIRCGLLRKGMWYTFFCMSKRNDTLYEGTDNDETKQYSKQSKSAKWREIFFISFRIQLFISRKFIIVRYFYFVGFRRTLFRTLFNVVIRNIAYPYLLACSAVKGYPAQKSEIIYMPFN